MKKEEAIEILTHPNEEYQSSDGNVGYTFYPNKKNYEAFQLAIKALEPKPYQKFESTKDHIFKLAGDYKCWDERLTREEALELCHILEQEPCEDCISRQAVEDAMYDATRSLDLDYGQIMSYIDEIPSVTQEPKAGVLDKIRAEIEMYEADCRLQGGTHECEKCNDSVFGSIYRIIDKYKESEEEE